MKNWTIDTDHTDASFSVRHLGISNIRGSFQYTEGTITTNMDNTLTSVNVRIDVASIATRNKDRDGHIVSEDFFYVEKYPDINFTSTTITKVNEKYYKVEGNLTIRGITRKTTLDVTLEPEIKDPFGLSRIGAKTTAEIDRQEFGLKFHQVLDNGSLLVGNKVKILIDSEMIQQ